MRKSLVSVKPRRVSNFPSLSKLLVKFGLCVLSIANETYWSRDSAVYGNTVYIIIDGNRIESTYPETFLVGNILDSAGSSVGERLRKGASRPEAVTDFTVRMMATALRLSSIAVHIWDWSMKDGVFCNRAPASSDASSPLSPAFLQSSNEVRRLFAKFSLYELRIVFVQYNQ